MLGFYESFNHDQSLKECVTEVVKQLGNHDTSESRPGMLLGKIQSGKTRGFLGVIAKAFDGNYDVAIVVTKGTNTLATQTVKRISADFREFIERDLVTVFDIMQMPERLTKAERNGKLIIVAKKEVNNLKRVIELFKGEQYPDMKAKRVLLVDDEADMAGIRFVKKRDTKEIKQGSVAQQLDDLRTLVARISFLQVTATPYALYLQPDDYPIQAGSFVFKPKKPAFTKLLPIHNGYVGGADYFGDFDEDDPRHYLFVEVPPEEQAVLRSEDGRTIRADRVWTSKSIVVLRQAVMTFILGVVVRRLQQKSAGDARLGKYAMIIHNDTQRSAHEFQWQTVERIRIAFETAAAGNDSPLKALFDIAYEDLKSSVGAHGAQMPGKAAAYSAVKQLIAGEEINVQRVNSDVQVAPLLDPATAELKLRAQANIFIGGSLLDRGITVPYLIAFYYGRDPKRMQADTVLQHSRMYGARNRDDLSVTRFYTSLTVFQRLRQIDDLETALREAFEKGGHEAGVVFIENDSANGIVPCAPNKISMSKVATVRPAGFYLPNGFDTVNSPKAVAALASLNNELEPLANESPPALHEVLLSDALAMLRRTKAAIQLPAGSAFSWEAMEGLLQYYAKTAGSETVLVISETGRMLGKEESGRKAGQSIVGGLAIRGALSAPSRTLPALVFLRQEGGKKLGWAGKGHFWWPVLAAPVDSEPCVFSSPKS